MPGAVHSSLLLMLPAMLRRHVLLGVLRTHTEDARRPVEVVMIDMSSLADAGSVSAIPVVHVIPTRDTIGVMPARLVAYVGLAMFGTVWLFVAYVNTDEVAERHGNGVRIVRSRAVANAEAVIRTAGRGQSQDEPGRGKEERRDRQRA